MMKWIKRAAHRIKRWREVRRMRSSAGIDMELIELLPFPCFLVHQDTRECLINTALKSMGSSKKKLWEQEAFKNFLNESKGQEGLMRYEGSDFRLLRTRPHPSFTGVIVLPSQSDHIYAVGKDFVANASHELRTPITIIKGFAETLHDLPYVSDVMLSDITDKILRSCERMDALVKNLLLLADIDHSRRFNKREGDIVALIESVSYTMIALHPDIQIETYAQADEIYFSFDPDMLEQALINLIGNAVKYSLAPASIKITVEKGDNEVVIRIEDQGIGIKEEHLQHLFKRFYRVNQDRSRKLGGAGLGLSIVKAIVDKHHGQIRVNSQEGMGSCFEMVFPFDEHR
jgi:signal transduction histidine kinase